MKKILKLESIWSLLEQIYDPEIPVISIVDLGIIRNVGIESGRVMVTIAPTFIGCPALHVIQDDIVMKLEEAGFEQPHIKISLTPPWSSNWITSEGRKKLKDFGLSPPPMINKDLEFEDPQMALCPYCDSHNTSLKNTFGSTLCRAIYYCNNCRQPFEQFKPI
jgi:ring-1,2-phenylacetyl-CoA epoxidase subunit PaaD